MQANVDLEDKKIMDIICSTGDPSSEDLNQLKRYGVQKGFEFKNQELQTGVKQSDLRFQAYFKILVKPNSVENKGYQTDKIINLYNRNKEKNTNPEEVKEGDVIEKDCKRSLFQYHKDEDLRKEQIDLELRLKSFFKVIQDKSYYQGLNSVMSVLQVSFEDPKKSLQIFEGLIKNHLS